MALCGTAVFGASLAHLTATPRLYGDPFQLNFTDPSGGRPDPALLRALSTTGRHRDHRGLAIEISVNKVTVGAIAGTPSGVGSSSRPSPGIFPTATARSASVQRRCARSAPIWARRPGHGVVALG